MKHKYILFFLFVSACILRLIGLNQSLWLDEATTAQTVKHYSYLHLITKFSLNDFHPPLYYLFMKAWTSIFGYSEIALRLPSVFFSLVTGFVVYSIGKKLKDSKTGLWSSAFFLFNPLIMYYSQEARMYLMVTFFLTAALYFFLQIDNSHSRKSVNLYNLLLLNLFIAFSLFTFYGSVFFIIGLYVYMVLKVNLWIPAGKREDDLRIRSLLPTLPGFIIALALLSPLLLKQYLHAKQMLSLVPHWNLVLGKANLKNLLLIPLKFSIGRIQFEPKKFYYLGAGAWTLFIFSYVSIGSVKQKMLGVLFFVPLLLGFVFSFFTPLLQYFRFLYLIPLLDLLVVIALHSDLKRGLYGMVFILLSCIYLLMPRFHRENWKDLVALLPNHSRVYIVYSSSDPLAYYVSYYKKSDIQIVDLSELNHIPRKQKSVIVIPYTSDIYGIAYKEILINQKFAKRLEFTLRGASLEKWERK